MSSDRYALSLCADSVRVRREASLLPGSRLDGPAQPNMSRPALQFLRWLARIGSERILLSRLKRIRPSRQTLWLRLGAASGVRLRPCGEPAPMRRPTRLDRAQSCEFLPYGYCTEAMANTISILSIHSITGVFRQPNSGIVAADLETSLCYTRIPPRRRGANQRQWPILHSGETARSASFPRICCRALIRMFTPASG